MKKLPLIFFFAFWAISAKAAERNLSQTILRSLSLLGTEQMPFNPNGFPMLLAPDQERGCSEFLKNEVQGAGDWGKPEMNWRELPPDFHQEIDKLASRFKKRWPNIRSLVTRPGHQVFKHSHTATMQANLSRGYESYGETACSGLARSWAAWIMGEAGIKEGIPYLERMLQLIDPSQAAEQQYLIALARLKSGAYAKPLLRLLEQGNLKPLKWTYQEFPYWLPGCSAEFSFSLSERGTAAIGLGFLKNENSAMDILINASLTAEIEKLLSPLAEGFEGTSLRYWGFPIDKKDKSAKALESHLAYLETLLFAVGRRQVQDAFEILKAYLMSAGHYSIGGNSGKKGEFGELHTVPILLLVSAMHSIDPEKTLEAVKLKLAEANAQYLLNDYSPDSPVWRYVSLDQALLGALSHNLSEQTYRDFVKVNPIIPHKTHLDL